MNRDMVIFLLENEDQILKELSSRTKYLTLFKTTSDYYKLLTTEYIKELCREHFVNVNSEELLSTLEDDRINTYIYNISLYLEGRHKNEYTH